MERHKYTKSEKEYIKALIQNLSLKRLTDQEIVDYLRSEKQIEIGRSIVIRTRNESEKQAAKWYTDLLCGCRRFYGPPSFVNLLI